MVYPFNYQFCYIYSQIILREEPLSPFISFDITGYYNPLVQGERFEKHTRGRDLL